MSINNYDFSKFNNNLNKNYDYVNGSNFFVTSYKYNSSDFIFKLFTDVFDFNFINFYYNTQYYNKFLNLDKNIFFIVQNFCSFSSFFSFKSSLDFFIFFFFTSDFNLDDIFAISEEEEEEEGIVKVDKEASIDKIDFYDITENFNISKERSIENKYGDSFNNNNNIKEKSNDIFICNYFSTINNRYTYFSIDKFRFFPFFYCLNGTFVNLDFMRICYEFLKNGAKNYFFNDVFQRNEEKEGAITGNPIVKSDYFGVNYNNDNCIKIWEFHHFIFFFFIKSILFRFFSFFIFFF